MKNTCHLTTCLSLVLLLSACANKQETLPAITITAITPGTTMMGGSTIGSCMIGDTISITGQNFSPVITENHVSVQSIPAAVTAASENELKAIIPAGVPFAYADLEVSRPGYQKAIRKISVNEFPAPVITGLHPTSGPAGTVITIYGKHLNATMSAAAFGFTDMQGKMQFIKPFTPLMATPDSIQVSIPADAGTGPLYLWARPSQSQEDTYFAVVTPVFVLTE